jgi:hypothetical protein
MEMILALGSVWWLFVIVAAVMLALLPFFVFRIRNEVIELKAQALHINRNIGALTAIMRRSNQDRIPAPKPCPQCGKACLWPYADCQHCKTAIPWE